MMIPVLDIHYDNISDDLYGMLITYKSIDIMIEFYYDNNLKLKKMDGSYVTYHTVRDFKKEINSINNRCKRVIDENKNINFSYIYISFLDEELDYISIVSEGISYFNSINGKVYNL